MNRLDVKQKQLSARAIKSDCDTKRRLHSICFPHPWKYPSHCTQYLTGLLKAAMQTRDPQGRTKRTEFVAKKKNYITVQGVFEGEAKRETFMMLTTINAGATRFGLANSLERVHSNFAV